MSIDIHLVGPEYAGDLIRPIETAFGLPPTPERLERTRSVTELDTRIVAYDDGTPIAGAGAFDFKMSVPGGGEVATAGLTAVAVMPTHRRRGILTSMIRLHFEEARARKSPIASLWASESTIYGRYGYGLASFAGDMAIERDRGAFADRRPVEYRARFLNEVEALERFPGIYEHARKLHPGIPSRSPSWWRARRLADHEAARGGAGPLQRVLVEVDGQPAAYALYRITLKFIAQIPTAEMTVIEAIGAHGAGTRALWRYLLDVDLVKTVHASCMPVDHPLFMLLAEPRRMHFAKYEALWVRIVDVIPALEARAYDSRESLVLSVEDAFCPRNAGRYRLDGGARRVAPTSEPADLHLSVDALGSAYLGGVSFRQLGDTGRVEELTPDAIARADRLFRSPRAPWCPEIF